MSEAEQEKYKAEMISVPIEWHIPENIQSRYVTNVIVQVGANEIFISFFESQIPILMGTQEENSTALKRLGTVKAECIGRFVVAPDLMPDIINALQTGMDAYQRSKETKRGEPNK